MTRKRRGVGEEETARRAHTKAQGEAVLSTLNFARLWLDFSTTEIGRVLGVSWRTVYRWRSVTSGHSPQPRHLERLDQLRRLRSIIETRFTSAAGVATWLHSVAPRLGYRTPREVLLRGELDQVIELLLADQQNRG
jgi:uncharacterized protein (DUF2384 family)